MWTYWYPLAPGRHPLELCKNYFFFVSTQSPAPPHFLLRLHPDAPGRTRLWLAEAGCRYGWLLSARRWLVNMQTHVNTCTFCHVFPMAPACTRSAPAPIVAQTYMFSHILLQVQKVAPGCTRSAPAGNVQMLCIFIRFNAIAPSTPSPLYNTN